MANVVKVTRAHRPAAVTIQECWKWTSAGRLCKDRVKRISRLNGDSFGTRWDGSITALRRRTGPKKARCEASADLFERHTVLIRRVTGSATWNQKCSRDDDQQNQAANTKPNQKAGTDAATFCFSATATLRGATLRGAASLAAWNPYVAAAFFAFHRIAGHLVAHAVSLTANIAVHHYRHEVTRKKSIYRFEFKGVRRR